MKNILALLFACAVATCAARAQTPVNVQKTSGTNAITGSLVIGDGKTLTATGTGTIVATSAGSVAVGNITGLGTGVATALGVNTGSSGAFVVNGGALGTPSSGTLTNATGLPVGSGISGLGTGIATALAVNTGSAGAPVLFNGALGTPSSGTLTNATGLPIATGVSGLGSGVATFLATPSSANLASAVTGETGSGALVFGTDPTISGMVFSTNTLTSASGQNLTLSGGSSGASVTLGQGANGGFSANAPGTGSFSFTSGAVSGRDWFINSTSTLGPGIEFRKSGVRFAVIGTSAQWIGGTSTDLTLGATSAIRFYTNDSGTEAARISTGGNLLIGGTTDISGSGGLKVFGTTAATSTTTGALQVAGGVGVDGAAYIGGQLNALGTGAHVMRGYLFFNTSVAYPGGLGADGQARLYGNSVTGATLYGQGSNADFTLLTKSGNTVMEVPTGSRNVALASTTEATTGGAGSLTTAGGIYAAKKVVAMGGVVVDKTITTAGTTGAQTINKPAGQVNFAAAASTLVVTNSLVDANSIVLVQVLGTDATATSARVTKASGSFTITLNAAATAETAVSFYVVN